MFLRRMPLWREGNHTGHEGSWRDPIDLGAFSHTLFDLHGHLGSSRSHLHSDVIKLYRHDGLLELRAMTTEAQLVSNLETRGEFTTPTCGFAK